MKTLLFLLCLLALPVFGDDSIAPPGRIVCIEGDIVSGSSTGHKEWEGQTLLRVRLVEGKPKAGLLSFRWHPQASETPLQGKVKLTGYVAGEYTGTPDKAFDYIPRSGTTGFHFEPCFTVLKRL